MCVHMCICIMVLVTFPAGYPLIECWHNIHYKVTAWDNVSIYRKHNEKLMRI